jgi:hypothetical protein
VWGIGRKEDVVKSEVAVDQTPVGVVGNSGRQPVDQMIHIRVCLCFGGAILPGPTLYLSCNVIARLAEVLQADRIGAGVEVEPTRF